LRAMMNARSARVLSWAETRAARGELQAGIAPGQAWNLVGRVPGAASNQVPKCRLEIAWATLLMGLKQNKKPHGIDAIVPSGAGGIRRAAYGMMSGLRVRIAGKPQWRRGASNAMKGLGAGIAYGTLVEPRWIETTQMDVPIRGLASELDGYRVIHLTD